MPDVPSRASRSGERTPLLHPTGSIEIPVQCLPTGDVVFTSGSVGVRYVEAAEAERLRAALDLIARQAGDPITRQRARVALGRSPNEVRDA